MLIFNTDKPHNLLTSFRNLGIHLASLLFAVLILEIIPIRYQLFHVLIFPGSLAIIHFIYSLHNLKPNHVIIDLSKREIRASFNSALKDEETKVLSFDICRVRVERSRSFLSRKKKTEIIFYKNKSRQFELSSRETGFAETTLENLGEELERLTHQSR